MRGGQHHTIGNEKSRGVDERSLLVTLTLGLHVLLSRLDPPNDVVREILKGIGIDLHPAVVAVNKLVSRKETLVLRLAACPHLGY